MFSFATSFYIGLWIRNSRSGSGMKEFSHPDPGSGIKRPGSATHWEKLCHKNLLLLELNVKSYHELREDECEVSFFLTRFCRFGFLEDVLPRSKNMASQFELLKKKKYNSFICSLIWIPVPNFGPPFYTGTCNNLVYWSGWISIHIQHFGSYRIQAAIGIRIWAPIFQTRGSSSDPDP
jgi:hypothetical protein